MHSEPRKDLIGAMMVSLLVSYPVAALFEASFPLATLIPVAAVAAFGLVGFIALPTSGKLAFAFASVLATVGISLAIIGAADWSDGGKVLRVIQTMTVFGLLLSLALSLNYVQRNLNVAFLLVGFTALAALILAPGQYQEGRVSFDNSNPIWMARAISYVGLAGFALFLADQRKWALAAACVLACLAGILMTGSRGPLLGVIAAIAFTGLATPYPRRRKWVIFGGLAAAAVVGVAVTNGMFGDLRGLTFNMDDASLSERARLLAFTTGLIAQNPDGVGVGWFAFFHYQYPHNLFLEVIVEWGWVAGTGFVFATMAGTVAILHLPANFAVLKMVLISELVNAAVSGDATSPRFLYAILFLGLVHLLHSVARRRAPALADG